jgi:hypothetical protein
MTDQKPEFQVLPHPDLAALGTKTPQIPELLQSRAHDMVDVLNYWWLDQKVTFEIQAAMWDALTFGCGLLRTGWDESLFGGAGEATLRRVDPFSVLPDPQAGSLDDARYILEVRRVPFWEIKQRFPERADYVVLDQGRDEDAPQREKRGMFERLPLANLGATGVTGEFPGTNTPGIPPLFGPPGSSSEDFTKTVLLKEAWVRSIRRVEIPVIENAKVRTVTADLPQWDYVATASGVVLTPDTSNPFNHGMCPYVRIPMVEQGEFWSIPLTEHLMPVQIAMNRLLAAAHINAELVGNPIMLEGKNTGLTRTKIVNRPGGRLTVNDQSFDKIKWLEPPNMPQFVHQLIQWYRDTVDRISGISSLRGGQLRKNTPGEAVDAVQEASFVRIRAVMRNMEDGLGEALEQVVSNIVQFYVEPRTIPLLEPDGKKTFKMMGPRYFYYPKANKAGEFKGDDEPMRFTTTVEAGSSQPTSRHAKAAEGDNLAAMGVIGPRTLLTKYHHMNPADVDEALAEVQQMQQNQQQVGQTDQRIRRS